MLRPCGVYREHIGAKTQRYKLFELCFLVLSQDQPTKIMPPPPPGVPVASLCFHGTSNKHIRVVWTRREGDRHYFAYCTPNGP